MENKLGPWRGAGGSHHHVAVEGTTGAPPWAKRIFHPPLPILKIKNRVVVGLVGKFWRERIGVVK